MITQSQNQLWRVEWVHRSGYRAPHYWVEAKIGKNEKITRRNGIIAAKEKSRLGDFPKTWYCKITEEVYDPPKKPKVKKD